MVECQASYSRNFSLLMLQDLRELIGLRAMGQRKPRWAAAWNWTLKGQRWERQSPDRVGDRTVRDQGIRRRQLRLTC